MSRKENFDLSVIVPSYNTCGLTSKCVSSILAHVGGLRCEVIVVDDVSSDGTAEYLISSHPQIHVIRNAANLGYGGSINQGVSSAHGRYIAISNSDVEVLGGALSNLVSFMDAHPEAGAAAPTLLNGDLSLQKSISRHPSVLANLIRLIVPKAILESTVVKTAIRSIASALKLNSGRLAAEPTDPTIVDCVIGAFFIVRQDLLERIGGFDSDRFYLFCEESDLFIRIQETSHQLFYVPSARVIHHGSGTVKLFKHRYLIQQYKSFLLFYEKHAGAGTAITYRVALTPIFALKVLWYALASLVPWGDRLERLRRLETYTTIIRMFYDPAIRKRNVIRELCFRYIS